MLYISLDFKMTSIFLSFLLQPIKSINNILFNNLKELFIEASKLFIDCQYLTYNKKVITLQTLWQKLCVTRYMKIYLKILDKA